MKFTNKVYDTDVQEQYDVDKKGPSKTPGQKMDIDKRNKRFKTPPCMIDNKKIKIPEYNKNIIGESKITNKTISKIIEEAKELLGKNWAAKYYKDKSGKRKPIKENLAPYIDNDNYIDSDPEETKMANDAAFKPEKLEDDLPVEKVLKNRGRFNKSKLRLEYFRNLLNSTEEPNEEI